MKKNSQSMKRNIVLNVIKSSLSVVFPLITYPYIFRVLGAENIGKVDYAVSVVNYFVFLAVLGVPSYAVREGAKIRERKEDFQKLANELFSISIIATILSYMGLAMVLLMSDEMSEYRGIIIIVSFSVAFTAIGIDWINTIYEDFLFITMRSIATHVVSLVLLFVFVRQPSDYYYYALLTVITNMIICLSNWKYCKKYVKLKFTPKLNLRTHIKPIMTLFANTVAINIYVNADVTMLGAISGDYYVGIYALAVRIYSVLKNIVAAVYSTMIPRISYYIENKNKEIIKKTYSQLISGIVLILFPLCAGVYSLARECVLMIGGVEYMEAEWTLKLLGISLTGAIGGGIFTSCLNVPLRREKINLKATAISAVLNIAFNMLLIPVFNQNGAAVTTAMSEFFVFIYCMMTFKDLPEYIDMGYLKKNIIHSFIGVASVMVIALCAQVIVDSLLMKCFIVVIGSVMIYLLELSVLKNEMWMNLLAGIRRRYYR